MDIINNTTDLKNYIAGSYTIPFSKFEFIKRSVATWLYLVTKDGHLVKKRVYTGSLPTVNVSPHLMKYLIGNIEAFLKEHNYIS